MNPEEIVLIVLPEDWQNAVLETERVPDWCECCPLAKALNRQGYPNAIVHDFGFIWLDKYKQEVQYKADEAGQSLIEKFDYEVDEKEGYSLAEPLTVVLSRLGEDHDS